MKAKQILAPVFTTAFFRLACWAAVALACWAAPGARAAGTWTTLAKQAPDSVNTMLLMPDGSVIAADAGDSVTWFRLTPDIHGSYINGTWTTNAAMHDSRLYYSSEILTNGRMFIAGAEYGTGGSSGEIYDPAFNTWTMITGGAGQTYYDEGSVVLPDSTILLTPVFPAKSGQTAVYNPQNDSWPLFPQLIRGYDEDEASMVMLADNSILLVDAFTTNSERYIPSESKWVDDSIVPVPLYDPTLGELGSFFLLANSNVFAMGNVGFTAIYTPSGTTSPGSWVAGPNEPNGLGVPDGPGAMMTDGNILCVFAPSTNYIPPTSFFEYDPVANAFDSVPGPGSFTNNDAPYIMRMLDLPDGGVLLSVSGRRLYEYMPSGTPLAAGKPTITSITTNYYGSYHLTGTLLNGISQGAAYGDDAQMNSNYPLIRMTNAAGNVYYARSYNWSSTVVMTGSLPVTTDFIVPQYLPAGTYSLFVVANGISSSPVSFTFAPDALQISSLNGFGATGPNTGPVAPQSLNYTLTNTGSSSLDWAVGNIPVWLNVSNASGTLANTGSTAVVNIGLNTMAAAALPIGNYSATVWFTNVGAGAIQGVPFSYQSTPLVVNGGFEYGSAAFWTVSGNLGYSTLGNTGQTSGESEYIHSGFYGVLLGENGGLGDLSQTIPTVAGEHYNLSFWLDSFADNDTNEFIVTWNGTTVFALTNVANFGFTNIQVNVVGAAMDSVLQFAFNQDTNFNSLNEITNYFGLDDVSLTAQIPPTIAVQPTNESVLLAGTAIFAVQALGPPPLYFQWQFDGTNVANATNSVLTLTNVTANEAGTYAVIVTNAYGSLTSSNAVLTVILPGPPVIIVPPASQNAIVTGTASFSVQALGNPPLFYQWKFNGGNITGATNAALTLTNVTLNQGGNYTVTVSDAFGSVTSPPAFLTVLLYSSVVQNGGFETGDFTDWTVTGDTNFTEVVDESMYTHSGVFGVQAGPYGSPEYISQTLPTVPGQAYLISCWINNPEGATPNQFLVSWNGINIANEVNITSTNWVNIEATAVATGSSTILSFAIQDNPGYLGLDDISVNPVPQPSFLALKSGAGAIVFQWSTVAGLSYQLQSAPDLQSNWTNLGGAIIASNTIATATDVLTNSQRFYRLLLLP